MKYRLLKDLPGVDSGAISESFKLGDAKENVINFGIYTFIISNLLSLKWIEEVKEENEEELLEINMSNVFNLKNSHQPTVKIIQMIYEHFKKKIKELEKKVK